MISRIACVALLALCRVPTLAADEPAPRPSPTDVARRALAAFDGSDEKALAALAGADGLDPWIVADELLGLGRLDVARAFARAAPRPALEALPGFLAGLEPQPAGSDAARALLARAVEASSTGRFAQTLELLAPPWPEGDALVKVRLETARAYSLASLDRVAEASQAYAEVARDCATLGWRRRAAETGVTASVLALRAPDPARALELAPEALAHAVHLGDERSRASALQVLATAHDALGHVEETERYAKEAFGPLDALGDEKAASAVLELWMLAATRREAHAEALGLLERMAARHVAAGRTRSAVLARANRLGLLLGLNRVAEVLEDEPAVRAAAHAGGWPDLEALGLAARGEAQGRLGELVAAREHLEQALRLEEGSGGRGARATTLQRLGLVLKARGELEAASGTFERMLEVARRTGDALLEAVAWEEIGWLHNHRSAFGRALDAAENSLAVARKAGSAVEEAQALALRGAVFQNLGHSERALEDLESAARLFAAGSDRPGRASLLVHLATTLRDLGEPERALEPARQAVAVADLPGLDRQLADALLLLGLLQKQRGEFEAARAAFERVQALGERFQVPAHVCNALRGLAALDLAAGRFAQARERLERALQIADGVGEGAPRSPLLGELTNLHALEKRSADVLRTAREAVRASTSELAELGGEQRVESQEEQTTLFALAFAAALILEDLPALAYFLECSRGAGLRESLRIRDAVAPGQLPADLHDARQAARGREADALRALRKAQAAGDRGAVKAARAVVDEARKEAQRVFERIQSRSRRLAVLEPTRVDDLATLRARLAADEALILFGRPPDVAGQPLFALVLTRGQAVARLLGAAAEVDAAARALELERRDQDPEPALRDLRRLVVAPLELPATVKRVLVSPDATLAYVPFALLLAEREVAYVPSGTTHGMLLEEAALRGEGVLALGDPDYGAESLLRREAEASRGRGPLVRLPGTAVEAKAVGDVVLLGSEATEAGLNEALARRPRWRSVHLACHGLVDPARPLLSALALTPTASDDGYLSALDVFQLKVPADLVVLSACETGRGKVYQAEGIVGLARAFMCAGAPRVLVSLWKVDDAATAALMTRFYARLKEGAPHARALRDAQEHVRTQERWKHPFYWAAWVLWGLPQ